MPVGATFAPALASNGQNFQNKTIMKKLLLLFLAGLMLAACRVNLPKDEGPEVTSVRHARPFKSIEVVAACNVKFTQGDTFSVKIVGPKGRVEQLETRFSGSKLILTSSGEINLFDFRGDRTPTVYVTSPDLVGVRFTGVGDFEVDGPLDTDTLKVMVEGTGNVELKSLICDEFYGTLVGTGNIDVDQLTSQRSRLELSGTGDIDVHFKDGGYVDCSLLGTGDVKLSGTVKRVKTNVKGTGDVDTKGLVERLP